MQTHPERYERELSNATNIDREAEGKRQEAEQRGKKEHRGRARKEKELEREWKRCILRKQM